jgi:5-dehydro-2-deoxygluconokinase
VTEAVLDLIAIGRSSVDLYGEQVGGRLEDMGSFAKYIGGSPTNTAIGAARLGLRAALITRVGADHFGRFIREELEHEGVETRAVASDPARLTALVVLGIRDREQFPLLFYRQDCADMALCAADIDPAFIASAQATLISGTHLSTPPVFAASLTAARAAKAVGRKVAFDIDYRPVLWGLTAPDRGEDRFVADVRITERLREAAGLCDLIVGTEEEFRILGGEADAEDALRAVRRLTSALLVCKRGPQGCVAFAGEIGAGFADGEARAGFDIEVFNVLGAGDAFMAGFLRGWLRGAPVATCCDYANACGALVVSRHGCAPAMPTWPELSAFLDGGPRPRRLREDAELEHLHWATTRRGDYAELCVLALDHRPQFEALAAEAGADPARIEAFKVLGLEAARRVAGGDPGFGLLLDGRYGQRALELAADTSLWIARPIEAPGSRPLEFEGGADVGASLREWPLGQVVKCLVQYHPDDDAALKARQLRQLQRLFHAARATRHELLVEVIAASTGPVDDGTLASALGELYAAGLRPDWWKLEPQADAAAWAAIAAAIEAHDPLCRGVLVLGQSARPEALAAAFETAAGFDVIKGFAVGRTIFEAPARAWLAGEIDDAAATDRLAEGFAALMRSWRSAKARARSRTAAE